MPSAASSKVLILIDSAIKSFCSISNECMDICQSNNCDHKHNEYQEHLNFVTNCFYPVLIPFISICRLI
jgi:hypothetical protein